jgi:hypothetical protein
MLWELVPPPETGTRSRLWDEIGPAEKLPELPVQAIETHSESRRFWGSPARTALADREMEKVKRRTLVEIPSLDL